MLMMGNGLFDVKGQNISSVVAGFYPAIVARRGTPSTVSMAGAVSLGSGRRKFKNVTNEAVN
jgi:hypothetical protein